ncbi:hypothetical protein PTSG_06956 [Salpingoeca rosetta]|uniref:G-protein coupled receptors family 2 profile 2 domain-containing protein n=1 Tax=Salpingoeca rosetta (strain ATCC 50818 / BSB-021) TaxID=946362 RepID=F2UFA6_SALR5|nr:uncharacterized protein PTSG_06956 [Salpingoeca rosetta]EGD75306.1 hypothetical protein PTSG_06956 [Salpingoeca rosetta]|eukprot:XP_004992359.1 hypothetical protein PTSG_06956 [Salpingoeca rosetta]
MPAQIGAMLCPGTNSEDWYALSSFPANATHVKLRLTLNHTRGDLDLYVVNATDASVAASSTNVARDEEIVLPIGGVVAADVFVAVAFYSGSGPMQYVLGLTPTTAAVATRPPSTASTASPVTTSTGCERDGIGLSIEGALVLAGDKHLNLSRILCGGEAMWYQVDVCAGCTVEASIVPNFRHAHCVVDMYLLAGGEHVAAAEPVTNHTSISYTPSTPTPVYVHIDHRTGDLAHFLLNITVSTSANVTTATGTTASATATQATPDVTAMTSTTPSTTTVRGRGNHGPPSQAPQPPVPTVGATPPRVTPTVVAPADANTQCVCPAELLDGVLWPAVAGCGALSHVQCPSTARAATATRRCTAANVLGRVNSTACSNDRLAVLATQPVTAANAAVVATTLSEETQSAGFIGAADVTAVARVLETMSNVLGNTSLGSTVVLNITTHLAATIDHLLDVNEATLGAAESNITQSTSSATMPALFGSVLARAARALPSNGSNMHEGANVVVGVFRFQHNQSYVRFPPEHRSSTSGSSNNSSNNSNAQAVVSAGNLLLTELMPTNPTAFFSFAVYRSARLFQSAETTSSRWTTTTVDADAGVVGGENAGGGQAVRFVNGPVLLAQADGDNNTPFKGTIRFRINKTMHMQDASDACVFWQFQNHSSVGAWSGVGCNATANDPALPPSVVECTCNHLTNFAIMTTPPGYQPTGSTALALDIITYAGLALSVPSLLLTFTVFACYRKLRTLGRVVIMHLCITLAVAMVLLVFGVHGSHDANRCVAVTTSLHFFLLSAFAWMLIEGVHLHNNFVVVFTRATSDTTAHLQYAAFAYLVPALIVGVTASALGPEKYVAENVCWLRWDTGAIWSFIGPLCFVVAANMVVFARILRSVISVGLARANNRRQSMFVRGAKVSASFFCVMGITWVFGILTISGDITMQYAFAILNAFQGLFIFVFHCLRDRTVQQTVRGRRETLPSQKVMTSSHRIPSTPKLARFNWQQQSRPSSAQTDSRTSTMDTPLSLAAFEEENFSILPPDKVDPSSAQTDSRTSTMDTPLSLAAFEEENFSMLPAGKDLELGDADETQAQ